METCGVYLQWLSNIHWIDFGVTPPTTRRSSCFVGHSYQPSLSTWSVGYYHGYRISWWWVVRILFLCDQNLILMRGSPCFMRGVFPTSCYSQSSVGNSIGKLLSHCCRSGEWWKSFESEMVKVIFGSLSWSFVYTIFYTDTSVVDFFFEMLSFFCLAGQSRCAKSAGWSGGVPQRGGGAQKEGR